MLFVVLTLVPGSLALSPTVLAQEPDYDRINQIAKNLNCPTCAGINLADCRTLTCQQWRDKIGDLIQEGYSDQEILDYFATRYGQQVLQEPPKQGFTLALWLLPVIALLAGAIWLVYLIRGWSQRPALAPVPAPASDAEPSSELPPQADEYLKLVDQDLEE